MSPQNSVTVVKTNIVTPGYNRNFLNIGEGCLQESPIRCLQQTNFHYTLVFRSYLDWLLEIILFDEAKLMVGSKINKLHANEYLNKLELV